MTTNTINPPELRWTQAARLVRAALVGNRAVLIEGDKGGGKSSLPVAVARELGWSRGWVFTASLAEPSDVLGLPVTRWHEQTSCSVSWEPIGVFAEVLSHASNEPAVLVLDDIGHARPDVQAALWPIVAERRIGHRRLPDTVRVVMTANRSTDAGTGARALLTPLATRAALRFVLIPDQEATLDYLAGRYGESQLASALLAAGRTISYPAFRSASPREWELALSWAAAGETAGLALDDVAAGLWPLSKAIDVAGCLIDATREVLSAQLAAELLSTDDVTTPAFRKAWNALLGDVGRAQGRTLVVPVARVLVSKVGLDGFRARGLAEKLTAALAATVSPAELEAAIAAQETTTNPTA